MKALFDTISFRSAQLITRQYSTSFSFAVKMLAPSIRQDIYNIYGFVRVADEIVDSFEGFDKEELLRKFSDDLDHALASGISTNPVLNAFQHTVRNYGISRNLIDSFMDSMRADLSKSEYKTVEEYQNYIYGSADVVGLMCLTVFVKGDRRMYDTLRASAMRLGSAFQKINFLRDLRDDLQELNRSYFPNLERSRLDESSKHDIIREIQEDMSAGLQGILNLPMEARLGVYVAYIYYSKLLARLRKAPLAKIVEKRIRVPNYQKVGLFAKCYVDYKFNLMKCPSGSTY